MGSLQRFPFSALEFGKSGIAKWCDTCGCLISGALAFSSFWGRKECDPLVNEVFLKGQMDCTPCHSGNKATQDKTKNHP